MMNENNIRILMVDDHAIVRDGYKALLAESPDLVVVAEATTAMEAYIQYKTHQPDVMITDLSLPGGSGLECISKIIKYDARAKIVVFTMHLNPELVTRAIQAGALGYVTKNMPPQTLIDSVYRVHQGKVALSSDIEKLLALESLLGNRTLLNTLSAREYEILCLLVNAHSTEEIAQFLNISQKTVCNYHYQIKSKLGVSSDIELTLLAIQYSLIQPMDPSLLNQ